MNALQIIFNGLNWIRSTDSIRADDQDVLFHPELVRMTSRQLADLPFPRPAAGRAATAKREPVLKRCA